MGMQGGADLFDDVAESPPAPESDFDCLPKTRSETKKKSCRRLCASCHTDEGMCYPTPTALNYNTVSTGRLFQHTSRLITLTSDPLCSEGFRSLRSMYLSSHAVTSRFLKKEKELHFEVDLISQKPCQKEKNTVK